MLNMIHICAELKRSLQKADNPWYPMYPAPLLTQNTPAFLAVRFWLV